MALILTRSPFHISRGALDADAGLTVEISRYIDGVSTILNTYNLTFRNKTFIDISNLINSEFIDSFTYNPATSSYEGIRSDVLLVRTTLSGTIDNVAQSDVLANYYATDGYLYSADNMNEDLSSVLRSNGYYAGGSDIMYKLDSSSLNIPLLNTSLPNLMENEIINSSFDVVDDWSIQTNDIIEDGVLKCGGDTGSRNYTNYTPVTGTTYRAQFTISNYTSGQIALFDGSGGVNISGFISANGTYTYEYTQSATAGNLFSLYSNTGFTGHIDNVFLGEITSNTYEEVTVDAKFNSSTVGTQTIEFDSDTNTAYQEVIFNIDDIDEVLITTDYGTKTIEVKPISECKFSPYILTFKNRYGVDEDLWFFKKSTKKINVSSEDFMANQFEQRSAGILTRSSQEYNKNGKESLEINSGFVPEAFNECFKQLLLSEEVKLYDYDNSQEYAVKITDSSLTYKTSVNDKLINYTIGVEFSNNVIDNIV